MSRDYGELEREFIEGLRADTGRDLGAWMALIESQAFAHRNDMIDWLRQQGLTFAKASRLERIHNNGGRPIYGDRPAARIASPVATASPPAPSAIATSPPAPAPQAPPPAQHPAAPPQPAAAPPPRAATLAPLAHGAEASTADKPADIAGYLARAKGYRPLAELLLRVIRETVPGTAIRQAETHLELAAPQIYGALAVTGKDVRLALDLGEHPYDGDLKRLRLPGTAATLTHTLVINDARRVDTTVKALLVAAAARINN